MALVVIDNLHKPTRHAKTVGIVIYQLGRIPSNNITLFLVTTGSKKQHPGDPEAETAPKAAPAAGGMSAVFNVGTPRESPAAAS